MARRGKQNWDKVITKLNDSANGRLAVTMGSPGSAQVTRVRLLEQFAHLDVKTIGSVVLLSIAA